MNDLNYRIEKRVANTDHWGCVGYADSRENAIGAAKEIMGGKSTGVRIVKLDPASDYPATPMVELIVGTD